MRNQTRSWASVACLIGCGLLACLSGGISACAQPTDYEVKAAFLLNFPRYVEWPDAEENEPDQPVIVGFFSQNNVSEALDEIIRSRELSGRPITIRIISSESEIADCHMIFVSANELQRLPALLEKLREANVLTVGESSDFLQNGGIINLVIRNSRVRIDVNLEDAKRSKLGISSKLLAVADVVMGRNH